MRLSLLMLAMTIPCALSNLSGVDVNPDLKVVVPAIPVGPLNCFSHAGLDDAVPCGGWTCKDPKRVVLSSVDDRHHYCMRLE